MTRKQYADYVRKFYWKPVFWLRSYCIVSIGGTPLEVIKKYIETQSIAQLHPDFQLRPKNAAT